VSSESAKAESTNAPLIIPKNKPIAVTLDQICVGDGDAANELIRSRFLCRNGVMLFVGPTGIGKSTFIMQMVISFACGKSVFGFIPKAPLKILVIQAENDESDIIEMRDGAMIGLKLSEAEIQQALKHVYISTENEKTGRKFVDEVLRPLLHDIKPDLVVIDPALAYLGDDMLKQDKVSEFTRGCLSPLLKEYKCGLIIVHHTNKTTNSASAGAAYAGAGSAEWANWARAIVVLMPKDGRFKLILAKRGSRIGWKQADGKTPLLEKSVGHSQEEGTLYWREIRETISVEELFSDKTKDNKELLLSLIPEDSLWPFNENGRSQVCFGDVGTQFGPH